LYLAQKRLVNPETYSLYLKGMYHINQRTETGMNKGLELLHKAVENDPNEPLAQAGVALGYCMIAHTPAPPTEASERSREAALKALALDENLAEVHLAMAMISIYFDLDKGRARHYYKRALEINPSLHLGLMHYSWFLLFMEDSDEIPALMNRAMEIDPLSPVYPAEYGWMCFFRREFDKSIEFAQKSLELQPDSPFALFVMGESYAGKKMYDEAIKYQKKSAELVPYWAFGLGHTYALAGKKAKALEVAKKLETSNTLWDTWGLSVIYAGLKEDEKFYYWSEQAIERRHPYIQWTKRFVQYFGDYLEKPRFLELIGPLNLPDVDLTRR